MNLGGYVFSIANIPRQDSPAEDCVGLFHNEALVRDAVVGVGAHDIGAFRQAGKVYLGGECPDLLFSSRTYFLTILRMPCLSREFTRRRYWPEGREARSSSTVS